MWKQDGQEIVINGWEQGIAPSVYDGLAEVSYGQALNYPGEFAAMGPLTAATVSGATLDLPVFKCTKPTTGGGVTSFFMLDAFGQTFYTDPTAQAWTFGSQVGTSVSVLGDSGMAYWKGYCFVFRATKPYYSASSTLASFTDWSGTVGSLTSGVTHFAFVGSDDVLYFCNGSKIGSIIQNAGKTFDPTDATTYTFNASALSIPSSMMATCLEQNGVNLVVGTSSNQIFLWDRTTPEGLSIPLYIGENFVYRMVTVNTNTYIFPSHPTITNGRGYIYVTNGSQVDIFAKLPDSYNDTVGTYSPEPYWTFGDVMYHRNKLFFGAKSSNGTSGVWCIDLRTGVIFRAQAPTTGTSAIVSVINPVYTGGAGVTAPLGYGFFTGSGTQASTCAMNYTTNTLSTAAVTISDKIPVGTFIGKKTFTQVEVKLAKPLVSGESVLLEYIDDNGTGTIGSITSTDASVGAVFPVTFQNSQWLQVKCTLTPTNTTPSYVRLKEVRLRFASEQ